MKYTKRQLACRHAAAKESHDKPVLTGVHLREDGGTVAANGHVLIALDPAEDFLERDAMTVPMESVMAARKDMKTGDSVILDSLNEPLAGDYPLWRNVFPDSAPTVTIRVNAEYLEAICRAAREYRAKSSQQIFFDIEVRGLEETIDPLVITGAQNDNLKGFRALLMPCRR